MEKKEYSDLFKREAITLLNELKYNGFVDVPDKEIKDSNIRISNVRSLCTYLGISSYSLYDWRKKLDISDEEEIEIALENNHLIEEAHNETFLNFGIGFYMWYARNLKIGGSYRIPLNQLKLKIGMKLIRESGLVDTKIR